MLALACTKFRKLPSELSKLSHGELNFIFASMIHESETIKKNVQLANKKRTTLNRPINKPTLRH